jgi:hypothetical protein
MTQPFALRKTEAMMLKRGYLSARMLAYKCGRHVATIRLAMRTGDLGVDAQVSQQQFTLVQSAAAWVGSSADLLKLHEWP